MAEQKVPIATMNGHFIDRPHERVEFRFGGQAVGQVRATVAAMALAMEQVLSERDGQPGKHGWEGPDTKLSGLMQHLYEEITEFWEASTDSDRGAWLTEGVDVNNMMMMCLQRMGVLGYYLRNLRVPPPTDGEPYTASLGQIELMAAVGDALDEWGEQLPTEMGSLMAAALAHTLSTVHLGASQDSQDVILRVSEPGQPMNMDKMLSLDTIRAYLVNTAHFEVSDAFSHEGNTHYLVIHGS